LWGDGNEMLVLASWVRARFVCLFLTQKPAYDLGLGIPAEPLFRSSLFLRSASISHLSCYDATPFNQILKQNAKREMRLRLVKVKIGRASCRERVAIENSSVTMQAGQVGSPTPTPTDNPHRAARIRS